MLWPKYLPRESGTTGEIERSSEFVDESQNPILEGIELLLVEPARMNSYLRRNSLDRRRFVTSGRNNVAARQVINAQAR
jgi:hypothetical protein